MTKEVEILRKRLEEMANRYHDLSKANEHHGTDSDYYVQTGINELADLARDAIVEADKVRDD